MLQEMAPEGVLHHKCKSRNRGVSWQKVVEKLNALPSFDVNMKSVRDRFNLLAKKYKVKMGKQERATGGGGIEVIEAENLLEELIAIEEDTNERADEESRARQIVEDEDKTKAIEMRKRAMESENGPQCLHISMYGHFEAMQKQCKICLQVNFLLFFHVNECKIIANSAKHPFNRHPD